ncbi:chitinase domain-containing protein 1 isoform X2 [Marmota monax]|uniref:chitinase domain-containing protein 1 isoform X2 n=1 Tax=Marmota monax TaxID=9995 RepID=UPI0026EF41CE|nr:chitinase domain-containing protein 1 isoform X2 [Marmota monax]
MQTLLHILWLILACGSVHTTLSKSDAKKAASKTLLEKTQFADKPVQDRGLVVTDLKAEVVVLEHRSYCSARARERNFAGDVLGYVTPWNSHGYDIAKVFGSKFTHISPVWLQLKRRGREMFEVTGLHDVDQGWMRAVRKHAKGLHIAPRLLFEGWTYDDFRNVLDNEDEIEELSKTVVQVAKNQHFDGFVVEVWSQLLSQKHVGLIHMLTHLAEALHQARLLTILVIPPAVTPGTDQLGMFTHKEFEQLAPVLDGFSLMTYDYSTSQQPGPNAPLSWVRACVQALDPKSKWRSKILLGLNFYGMDYAASKDAREPVIGASNPVGLAQGWPPAEHSDLGAVRLAGSCTHTLFLQVHPDAEGPQAPYGVGQPGCRALLRVQEEPWRKARRLLPNFKVPAGAAGAGQRAGCRGLHLGAGPGPGLLLRPAVDWAAVPRQRGLS